MNPEKDNGENIRTTQEGREKDWEQIYKDLTVTGILAYVIKQDGDQHRRNTVCVGRVGAKIQAKHSSSQSFIFNLHGIKKSQKNFNEMKHTILHNI